MSDSYLTACKELATHVAEGVYGAHLFIAIPRSPSEAEKKVNKVPNYVWPDLYFLKAGDGTEAVYVKVKSIPFDTLLPFGGDLVTHWEYLARKSIQAMAVATWIPVEDPDLDGRPLWYIPGSSDPRVLSLHTRVGAAGGKRSKELNVEIVWSVFGAPEFSSSARLFYRTLRDLNRQTRLWGPPIRGFFAKHMWSPAAKLAAADIRSRFLNGEECPHSISGLDRECLGHPGRDERIYGAYNRTDGVIRPAVGLPDSCVSLPVVRAPLQLSVVPASLSLPVSETQPTTGGGNSVPAPGVLEDSSVAAADEDPAVTFMLPAAYHGVLFQPEPRLKLLALKAAFMEPVFEPVASSDPPRATLAKWWKEVSRRIRDSYDKKAMPEDLKAAMRGRARLYRVDVVDVVDLAVEAAIEDPVAESSGGGSAPAKRSRRSVSRPRAIATSSSSSGQDGPGTGFNRGVLSRPRSVMGDGRGSGTAPGGASSASGSVGAGGALSAEEVELFKSLLLRVLAKL